MLSIGKLARVAGYSRADIETSERVQQSLEVIDDRLDIVASHNRLLELCKAASKSGDSLKPVETQAANVVSSLCSRSNNAELNKVCTNDLYVSGFRGLRHILQLAKFLLRRLLLGDALLPEDLVDLFSLKDNIAEDQSKDFAYSLEILSRDRQTPQSRKDIAAKSVWRRVYLADE